MTKNMGRADRLLRVLAAVTMGILILSGQITGIAAVALGLLTIVFILTGLAGTCPLYLPFRFTTGKKTVASNPSETL